MNEVTANQLTSTQRTYQFDAPVTEDMSWLNASRYINRYEVDGDTLTIHGNSSTNWDELENDFLIPGFKKAFGELKVNSPVSSR